MTLSLTPNGFVTEHPDLDFETYSEAGFYYDEDAEKWKGTGPQGKSGLPVVGAPVYAAHPSTRLLKLAYDLRDGIGPRLWSAGAADPADLFAHIKAGKLLEAWNSSFEFYIWHYVCHSRMGWPPLPLSQLRCAMGKGNAWGLPGKLGKAAEVLDVEQQKDAMGAGLIKKLCVPRTPLKRDKTDDDNRYASARTPETDAQLFKELGEYCVQDIRTEHSVSSIVPDLSPIELKVWQLDQQINVRGVAIDTKSLADCINVVNLAEARYTAELRRITGIPDATANTLDQLKGWLAAVGVKMPSMDKEAVESALLCKLPDNARRVLEIRQTLGAASVKKLYALDRTTSTDGRLRDLFVYHGARQTGRFAGMGAQPQNLPNSGLPVQICRQCSRVYWGELKRCQYCPDCFGSDPAEWGVPAVESALKDIATRDLDLIEKRWGSAIPAIAGCLRGLFIAPPGTDLICSDFSAIEAVVQAFLTGEQWRMEVFRTHGKIYEMSAAKISGVSFEEIMAYPASNNGQDHPLRKKIGKIAELASGFGGWVGSWKNFGADEFMNDDTIKKNVLKWRGDSPRIVEAWGGQYRGYNKTPTLYGFEGCAVLAIQNPGAVYSHCGISYTVRNNVLYCQLLSGRCLTYHAPQLDDDVDPLGRRIKKIRFMGWNSDSTKGAIGWMLRETYGGRLFENVVQATARDIMVNSMLAVDAAGYKIVLHVHDEIVSEIPADFGSIKEFERIMAITPSWCHDWPIRAAGGWTGLRYRKD